MLTAVTPGQVESEFHRLQTSCNNTSSSLLYTSHPTHTRQPLFGDCVGVHRLKNLRQRYTSSTLLYTSHPTHPGNLCLAIALLKKKTGFHHLARRRIFNPIPRVHSTQHSPIVHHPVPRPYLHTGARHLPRRRERASNHVAVPFAFISFIAFPLCN